MHSRLTVHFIRFVAGAAVFRSVAAQFVRNAVAGYGAMEQRDRLTMVYDARRWTDQ